VNDSVVVLLRARPFSVAASISGRGGGVVFSKARICDCRMQLHLTPKMLRRRHRCGRVQVRQCESLVRLTQARARAELRMEATEEDARDAVELMVAAMRDLFRDSASGAGAGGRTRARGKAGSKRKEAVALLERLQEIKRIEGKKEFSKVDLEVIKDDLRLYAAPLDTYLEALNDAGDLLKKGKGLWAPA
jgi:DNA replicative helicase MCM subunit Mcm2 (Cdc46/Mcm family)